jgi:hypothetical protein
MLNLGRLKTVAFWDKNTAKSVPIQENDDQEKNLTLKP